MQGQSFIVVTLIPISKGKSLPNRDLLARNAQNFVRAIGAGSGRGLSLRRVHLPWEAEALFCLG